MSVLRCDRVIEFAQALMEEDTTGLFGDDGGAALRLFVDIRFPDISMAEIRRGMEIAVECELMDGDLE